MTKKQKHYFEISKIENSDPYDFVPPPQAVLCNSLEEAKKYTKNSKLTGEINKVILLENGTTVPIREED